MNFLSLLPNGFLMYKDLPWEVVILGYSVTQKAFTLSMTLSVDCFCCGNLPLRYAPATVCILIPVSIE